MKKTILLGVSIFMAGLLFTSTCSANVLYSVAQKEQTQCSTTSSHLFSQEIQQITSVTKRLQNQKNPFHATQQLGIISLILTVLYSVFSFIFYTYMDLPPAIYYFIVYFFLGGNPGPFINTIYQIITSVYYIPFYIGYFLLGLLLTPVMFIMYCILLLG